MPLTNQAANFADILESIRDRLVSVTGISDDFVRSVGSDDYKYSFEETMIALRPLGPLPFTNAGGGRRARPETRIVRIYINKRSSLDPVGSDSVALGELFELENTVNDALDDWFPVDADDNVLTIEPLHPTDSTNGPPIRQSQNDVGEIYSLLAYEVVYLRPNNTPQP
jgi:hypothetical protein